MYFFPLVSIRRNNFTDLTFSLTTMFADTLIGTQQICAYLCLAPYQGPSHEHGSHTQVYSWQWDIGQSYYPFAVVMHVTEKHSILWEHICFRLMTCSLQSHEKGIMEGGRISIRTAAHKKEWGHGEFLAKLNFSGLIRFSYFAKLPSVYGWPWLLYLFL